MNETVKVIQSHNVPLVCSVFIIADFTINLRSRQVEVTTPSGMRRLMKVEAAAGFRLYS